MDGSISQHRFPRLRELYLPENEIEVIEGLNGCPGLQKVRLGLPGRDHQQASVLLADLLRVLSVLPLPRRHCECSDITTRTR
jgi:hypothetical protein